MGLTYVKVRVGNPATVTAPRRRAKVALSSVCFICLVALARPASSQAFLPPKGEGNVTIAYQDSLARGHLLSTGKVADGEAGKDPVRAHTLTSEAEFGLTDSVALNVSLPFVTSRYGGPEPHRIDVHGDPTRIDDGTYHGSWQDFRFGVRVNLSSKPLVITPFAEGIIPSHEYESRGHSVVGLDVRALVLGTNLAGFLDAIPGTYFQAQFSHAVVQKVAGIRPNRSRVDSEVGYFVTPRLALRFLESLQITHDGLLYQQQNGIITILGPFLPSSLREINLNHDRLSRNNFLNLGGGFSFAINESLDVFAAASTLVWGENVHPHRGVGIGVNVHFRTARALPKASPNQARPGAE